MRSLFIEPLRTAVSYLSIGLLTASSFAFGQNSATQYPNYPPAPPSSDQQQAANPSGGWRRVGDPPPPIQSSSPSDPNYGSNQAPSYGPDQSSDPNQPPPPPPPPPAPQNGTTSAPAYPSYQQPTYQQPSYPQPPYNSNQPNYSQQPNYPAPPPIPAHFEIPGGTFITVRVNQMLSSDKNQPGDAFSATLMDPIVANGIVVAEPGQTIGGRVAIVEKHHVGQPAKLGVQLTTLTLVDGQQLPINTQLTARQGRTTPGGVEAGTIVATTGLGAAIGAAAGWGRGAAIGAGAGAVVGLIGVLVTHNHASVIYPEQVLTFRLETPVTVYTQNSAQAFRYVEPGEYDRPNYAGAPGPYSQYTTAGPAPYYYGYTYPYPYPYYGYYGYPYYWGPSFGFYWGPGFYYGRGYFGGYRGGFYGGRGFVTGGVGRVGAGGVARGSAGHR